MKKKECIKKFVQENLIVLWLIASVIYAVVVHVLFHIQAPIEWMSAKWSAGEIMTYASTVSLGLLAVWQNRKIKEENDKAQDRLEKLTKQANEIAIIGKVIEYESSKLLNLEEAFDSFSDACNPQKITLKYANNCNSTESLLKAMVDQESLIDWSFFPLARLLRLDLSLNSDDWTEINRDVADYYDAAKNYVIAVRNNPLKSPVEEKQELEKKRNQYVVSKERYLIQREALLQRIICENLTIDEIRILFKKVEHL